jgi:hypothetical protein
MRRAVKVNPAGLLLEALDEDDLDSRVVEALPWLPVGYPKMDWTWLMFNGKVLDRQNRLAFVVTLAGEIAGKKGDAAAEKNLLGAVDTLERSRLAAEDTLCKETMTKAERTWLRTHRSPEAKHWNLLTDVSANGWSMLSGKRPHEPWDSFLLCAVGGHVLRMVIAFLTTVLPSSRIWWSSRTKSKAAGVLSGMDRSSIGKERK